MGSIIPGVRACPTWRRENRYENAGGQAEARPPARASVFLIGFRRKRGRDMTHHTVIPRIARLERGDHAREYTHFVLADDVRTEVAPDHLDYDRRRRTRTPDVGPQHAIVPQEKFGLLMHFLFPPTRKPTETYRGTHLFAIESGRPMVRPPANFVGPAINDARARLRADARCGGSGPPDIGDGERDAPRHPASLRLPSMQFAARSALQPTEAAAFRRE